MPRPARIQAPGARYHVTTRSAARRPIFLDRHDREAFMAIVATVVRKHFWTCTAYCVLSTHYHLLIATPEANLAAGMQKLNGDYGRTFNHRHGTKGHVFGSRYHSELIEADGHLLEACRYLALNPVRAGLCDEPESWPWSSYRAAVGLGAAHPAVSVDPLLRLFARRRERAQSRLREFVEEPLAEILNGV
jgi:REP element-mobilizing transposase RayT